MKLCNLSYIREYEQKFRKYAILARVDRTPEYLNKYILKIQGPVGLRLYQKNLSSIDLEIEAIILILENFQLYFDQEQFTLRTDCENIKKFLKIKILQNCPPKDG